MAEEKKVQEVEAPIHGDTLVSILTHVPLIDLVPACHVSKSWKHAVSTSLRRFNKIKPWLILHTQSTRSPNSTAMHAYDPRSQVWIQIDQPSIDYISALRSSHSTLLYMLSPSKFSFSFDPLHLTWHHADGPVTWRTDPVVAIVSHHVIIAGGTCGFEDDPLAVEIYDLETHTWSKCQSMPEIFKDSASATWLSVAVNSTKMYLAERSTGISYTFDPCTKAWCGPHDVRPEHNVCCCAIGFAKSRLILIGMSADDEKVESVKIWELNDESLEICKEIGEMPKQLVEKLEGGEVFSVSSMTVNVMGDFVYINNASAPEEVFVCEVGEEGGCSWSSVRNVAVNDRSRLTERLVFTCSNVGLGDLHRAMSCQGRRFAVRA